MNEETPNATAGGSPLDGGVRRLAPERAADTPLCCYCWKPAPGWTTAEAGVGKRWVGGTLEYHCYTAKCWD